MSSNTWELQVDTKIFQKCTNGQIKKKKKKVLSYLGQVRRGVEAAHVADLGVALGAEVVVRGLGWISHVELSLTQWTEHFGLWRNFLPWWSWLGCRFSTCCRTWTRPRGSRLLLRGLWGGRLLGRWCGLHRIH